MELFHEDSQEASVYGALSEPHSIVVSHIVATSTLSRGVFPVLFKGLKD